MMQIENSKSLELAWAKFCLGSNGSLHIVKCRIYSEMERKDKILVSKWDSLRKHVCQHQGKKKIRTNVNKEEWYYIKITCIPKTTHCVYFIANRLLLPNLEMGM
jgi:hypothetical protein